MEYENLPVWMFKHSFRYTNYYFIFNIYQKPFQTNNLQTLKLVTFYIVHFSSFWLPSILHSSLWSIQKFQLQNGCHRRWSKSSGKFELCHLFQDWKWILWHKIQSSDFWYFLFYLNWRFISTHIFDRCTSWSQWFQLSEWLHSDCRYINASSLHKFQ